MIAGRGLKFTVLFVFLSSCFLGFSCGQAHELPEHYAASSASPAPPLSEIANLIRVPLCRQAKSYTCGVASLQAVLGYYDDPIRQDILEAAVKSSEARGTDYRNIVSFARKRGYTVHTYANLTADRLRAFIDEKKPTILAIQAWADPPVDYKSEWGDGHYVVAVGYDRDNFYFMDPSTLGNFTFIPVGEFLNRWHDLDTVGSARRIRYEKLIHFGMVIEKKGPIYDPEAVLPLE